MKKKKNPGRTLYTRDCLRCCGGYRHPNDKRPPGLEVAGQISGQTTAGRAPWRPHKRLRVGFTRLHSGRTWRGFWPSDFADFLLQTSRFYGWVRSGGSTRMMALTARVSCCVFRVLSFNSNLFNFGPPSPSKLNLNGWAGPKLDGINNSGLKCYWVCFFFSFLRKTMDWGFYIYSYIIFFIHG